MFFLHIKCFLKFYFIRDPACRELGKDMYDRRCGRYVGAVRCLWGSPAQPIPAQPIHGYDDLGEEGPSPPHPAELPATKN